MTDLTPSSGPGEGQTVLAVAIGNTRARWGLYRGRESDGSASCATTEAAGSLAAVIAESSPDVVAVASVAGPEIAAAIRSTTPGEFALIGRDAMPPLKHDLEDASTLGIDRALDAYAAFSLVEQACVVIDAGTAITVDFIDGEGVFRGGAIAPGVRMMLRSLHEHTAALPEVAFELPDLDQGPFGRDTAHAMRVGVIGAARGLVRELVERYSERYGAYPRVIATGGDAAALYEDDGLVERIIPDLQLIGIQRTIEHALDDED